jgi:hypothetical protein
MNSLAPLWHSVWIIRIGLQAILLAGLVWRQFFREFPAFLLFTAWAVIRGVTLADMVYARSSGIEYFQAYWVGAAGDAVLSFAVLYELLRHILRNYPVLKITGSSLYRWAVLFLLAVALVVAWFAPIPEPNSLMGKFYALQRSVRLLECGLLAFLFIFAHSFGLSWRSRPFGIALGFGVSAMLSLASATIRAQIDPVSWNRTANILALAGQVSDLTGVVIWMAYLLAQEGGAQVPPMTLPGNNLRSWNRELRRLLP